MKRIFILVFLFLSKISFANSIVADLSIDSININTGFNGAELFLFGTYDGQDGDDLFIFIEGPKTEATIYKKEYFYGIWINRENVTFKNESGVTRGFSQYKYDFKGATKKGVIYPSLDPSIFELKFPNTDIKGRVITY